MLLSYLSISYSNFGILDCKIWSSNSLVHIIRTFFDLEKEFYVPFTYLSFNRRKSFNFLLSSYSLYSFFTKGMIWICVEFGNVFKKSRKVAISRLSCFYAVNDNPCGFLERWFEGYFSSFDGIFNINTW